VTQLRRNQPLRQGQPPNPLVQDQNRAEQNITVAMVTVMTKTTTVVVAGTAVTVAAKLVRNGNTVTATNARASTRQSSTLLPRRPKHLLGKSMRTAKVNVGWQHSPTTVTVTTRITSVAVTGITAIVAEKMEMCISTATARPANAWIRPLPPRRAQRPRQPQPPPIRIAMAYAGHLTSRRMGVATIIITTVLATGTKVTAAATQEINFSTRTATKRKRLVANVSIRASPRNPPRRTLALVNAAQPIGLAMGAVMMTTITVGASGTEVTAAVLLEISTSTRTATKRQRLVANA